MHADEESLRRTPPSEEEGFHQSLSTPGTNSCTQNEAQVSSKRNPHHMNVLKDKCRLAYMLDPEL